jgi:hypothetical protein
MNSIWLNSSKVIAICLLLVATCFITGQPSNRSETTAPSQGAEKIAPKPAEVVKRFWELAHDGDFVEAQKLTTATLGTIKLKDKKDNRWLKLINEQHLTINGSMEERIKGDKAKVIAIVTGDYDPHGFKLEHFLVYQDGSWKILSIYYPTSISEIDDPF